MNTGIWTTLVAITIILIGGCGQNRTSKDSSFLITGSDTGTVAAALSGKASPSAPKQICDARVSKHFCFVKIKPGTFTMGDDFEEYGYFASQPHKVTLTKSYQLQTTPVTQGLWKKFMSYSERDPSYENDDYPVYHTSWILAKEFIKRLNKSKEARGYTYRLPTEAEWEYAARAGTHFGYSFGDDISLLPKYGWFAENSRYQPRAVATKLANPWGLYDMHGNTTEWVEDVFKPSLGTDHVVDPLHSGESDERVFRGGDFDFGGSAGRSAWRWRHRNDFRESGLRLARTRTPKTKH